MDAVLGTIQQWFAARADMGPAGWIMGLVVAVGGAAAWRWARWLWQAWFYVGQPWVWPKPWETLPPAPLLLLDPEISRKWYDRFSKSQDTDAFTGILVVRVEAQPHEIRVRVVGQSSKCYWVTVGGPDGRISCDCHDGTDPKGRIRPDGSAYDPVGGVHHCKHAFFVKIRVLRIPLSHHYIKRLVFRPWEVAYMAGILKQQATAPRAILDALDGATQAAPPCDKGTDVCAICYEVLDDAPIEWCRGMCRQYLHTACVADLKEHAQRGGYAVQCPHCRSPWVDAQAQARVVEHAGRQYMSVADVRGRRPPSRSRSPAARGRSPARQRTR